MIFPENDLTKKAEKCIADPEFLKKCKKPNNDEYFMMRKRGMIRNPEYRKLMAGKGTVYEYIWSNIVRNKMYKDPHNIKENYYDKGFLAYCSTYRYIAKECFLSTSTVSKYIEEFEAEGVVETKKIGVKPKEGQIDRRPTIFILGTWQKNKKDKIIERYYMEDRYYR